MGSNSLSYIGLAYRAGRALAGTEACEKGIKRAQVRLLLMQQGLSESTKERFKRLCEKHGVSARIVDGTQSLGSAIGRPEIMIVGVTDQGLANTAKNIIDGVKGSGLE